MTSADGARIGYDLVGGGPAVILVGGAFQHRAIDPRTAHLADLLGKDFEAVAHTLAYDAALMDGTVAGGPLPADRWATVTVPVLVADGGASPPAMRLAADTLAGLLPTTRRITLAGQDHGVDPEVIAPVLADFYAG